MVTSQGSIAVEDFQPAVRHSVMGSLFVQDFSIEVDCHSSFSTVKIASNKRFRVVQLLDYGDNDYHVSGAVALAKERVTV